MGLKKQQLQNLFMLCGKANYEILFTALIEAKEGLSIMTNFHVALKNSYSA